MSDYRAWALFCKLLRIATDFKQGLKRSDKAETERCRIRKGRVMELGAMDGPLC